MQVGADLVSAPTYNRKDPGNPVGQASRLSLFFYAINKYML